MDKVGETKTAGPNQSDLAKVMENARKRHAHRVSAQATILKNVGGITPDKIIEHTSEVGGTLRALNPTSEEQMSNKEEQK